MNSESFGRQSQQPESQQAGAPRPLARRSFPGEALTLAAGGVATLFSFVIGLVFLFDPLRRRRRTMPDQVESLTDAEGFVRVAHVDAVPDDGTPRLFPVIADRVDAWTYHPQRPIGAVFLRKLAPGTENGEGPSLAAFSVVCPHLGCGVDYKPQQNNFHCPCHNSSFSITGERSASSPSARDLDTLPVRVTNGEVLVKYQEFRSGTAEKIAET